jgi:hypothetical protein
MRFMDVIFTGTRGFLFASRLQIKRFSLPNADTFMSLGQATFGSFQSSLLHAPATTIPARQSLTMTAVPAAGHPEQTITTLPAASQRRPLSAGEARWLVAGCYLLGALYLTGRLWINPAGRAQTGDMEDVYQFAWYMRYAATAVEHGHLPALVTSALNAPQGVNLMWNTPFLLPGILLAPVTLLAGPQVSLTLMLTAGFAGSAASLFFVLRRWGVSLSAAAIGGAVYGFSPALVDSGIGHYNFQFAVLPPLLIHLLLRVVTGRGGAVRNGAGLGLLAAAQLFTGSELLADTGLAGLILVVVLAAGRPREAVQRARGAAAGLGTAAAVWLLICSYPLWVLFFGQFAEHNTLLGAWHGDLGFFVDAPGTLLFHTPASASVAAHFYWELPEYLSYLGWPLIAALVTGTIWFWRDLKARAAAVACLMLVLLSQGGGDLRIYAVSIPGWLLPFHWVQGLPLFSEALPDRFSILADGAAAALLALSVDRARSALPRSWGARARVMPAAVAVLAVLPLIPLPYQAGPVAPVPAGYQAAFARLRLASDARVLVVPVPDSGHDQAMRWQAATGEPSELIGGYFYQPGLHGQRAFYKSQGDHILWQLWLSRPVGPAAMTQMRAEMAYWRPAAVVAVTGPGSRLADFLTGLLGRPAFQAGSVLAWRL